MYYIYVYNYQIENFLSKIDVSPAVYLPNNKLRKQIFDHRTSRK